MLVMIFPREMSSDASFSLALSLQFETTLVQNEAGTVSTFIDTFNIFNPGDSIKNYSLTEMEWADQDCQDDLILDVFSPIKK